MLTKGNRFIKLAMKTFIAFSEKEKNKKIKNK